MTADGWEEADRLDAVYEDARAEVLMSVSILDVSEALGVQLHGSGLTCPSPHHAQSGASAPASVFVGREGYELWKCHGCGEAGTAIDFVQLAGHADDYAEALEVLQDLASARSTTSRHRMTPRHQAPPEDRRRRSPVSGRQISDCERWATGRGWEPDAISQTLGRDRWGFVYDFEIGEHFIRVYTDDDRESWQDRPIPDGLWRSAYGRPQRAFWWEPRAWVNERRPLVVEGAADFLTAVVAQDLLGPEERFLVVGLPGASRTNLLAQCEDWVVITDNDDAGRSARARIDAEQSRPVRHLFVPAPYNDLNDWWVATRPPERRRWIESLVAQKDAPGAPETPPQAAQGGEDTARGFHQPAPWDDRPTPPRRRRGGFRSPITRLTLPPDGGDVNPFDPPASPWS